LNFIVVSFPQLNLSLPEATLDQIAQALKGGGIISSLVLDWRLTPCGPSSFQGVLVGVAAV
jgi:hypothetical protein